MAYLYYGAPCTPIEIPDALLAHLQIVISTKMRRNESFLLTWHHADGSGRSAIWLQPAIPIRFVFDDAEHPQIDRTLLTQLAESANSNGGLVVDLNETAAVQVAGAAHASAAARGGAMMASSAA